jgi:hypothetical protein
MRIDETTLHRLLDLDDALGVLTLTTGFTPDRAGTAQSAARIELRNQLKELQQQLDDAGDTDRLRALEKQLGALGDDYDGLLDPRSSGQGRALFVGLATGERERFNIQVPFESRAVIHERAFIRPLVAAIDEGRRAGIVLAHRFGVRILEWSLGETREFAAMDFELTDALTADTHRGPAPANPARAQHAVSHREAFEDRIEDNRHRFLKQAAATAAEFAADRGWDRIVVAGSEKIRTEIAELVNHARGREVLALDASWDDLSPGQIAQEAWPILRSVHRQRERHLVEQAQEAALSGGAGALGPKRVCEAINIGRVGHLLFTVDSRLDGYVAADGTLHATVGGRLAQADLEVTREPYLVERLVEKTLAMGGRVTRVDDEDAARELAPHDGVAALLRW